MKLSILCAWLLGVSAVAGCAPVQAPTNAATPATRPVALHGGKILSMRAVVAPSDPVPWRSILLADASGAGSAVAAAPVMEFIVRADDGAMLSVVQANANSFHPGDRVVIRYGAQTHLAREN